MLGFSSQQARRATYREREGVSRLVGRQGAQDRGIARRRLGQLGPVAAVLLRPALA